jgi:hypothetical protein
VLFVIYICYVQILLDVNCHDGLQIVILDPGWSLERDILSRNILGQDMLGHVHAHRPAKPSALMQLPQLMGLTCFARLQQRHV